MRSAEKKIGPGDVAFTAGEIVNNIGSAANKLVAASQSRDEFCRLRFREFCNYYRTPRFQFFRCDTGNFAGNDRFLKIRGSMRRLCALSQRKFN
jgi:hypothetical protein